MQPKAYILTLVPPTSRRELIHNFEDTGGRCLTNITHAMALRDQHHHLGWWTAPRSTAAYELCFLRCAATAATRMKRLVKRIELEGWPCSEHYQALRELAGAEVDALDSLAGKIVALAPVLEFSPTPCDRRFARLGEALGIDPDLAGPVSLVPPTGRRVSTFGGVTMLDKQETQALCAMLGCDLAMAM